MYVYLFDYLFSKTIKKNGKKKKFGLSLLLEFKSVFLSLFGHEIYISQLFLRPSAMLGSFFYSEEK